MQQLPLIAGAKAKQRANLVRGQAVDVAQRHNGPLPRRQLSQAILQLAASFRSHGFVFG